MGRYYRFSKRVTEEQSKRIEEELRKIDDVESVEITEDHLLLKVVTKDNEFAAVMGKAVNVCSREAAGTEVFFARFAV